VCGARIITDVDEYPEEMYVNVTDETQGERAKESIRTKCLEYLDRAEKLKECLNKGKPKKQVKAGENNSK
jgi:hypothetical protein